MLNTNVLQDVLSTYKNSTIFYQTMELYWRNGTPFFQKHSCVDDGGAKNQFKTTHTLTNTHTHTHIKLLSSNVYIGST